MPCQPSSAVVELRKERETFAARAYPDGGSPLGRACIELGIPLADYHQIANWQALSGAPWGYGYGWTHGVQPSMVCSPELGVELLLRGIGQAYDEARERVGAEAFDALDQGKVDAVTDFAYNVRLRNPDGTWRPCHLLDCVTAGDFEAAAGEFRKWCHDASGHVERGLQIARAVEEAWFRGLPRPAWTLDPHVKPPEAS